MSDDKTKDGVTITYFKPSGKYYCEDTNVAWPPAANYTKWMFFADLVRMKDMIAVCMENPLGFPQMYVPPKE